MAGLFDKISASQGDAVSSLGEGLKSVNAERILDIRLDLIDDMEGNDLVFGYDREEIEFLKKEIQESGFHDPITVTAKPGGRYTCISGHQRKLAMQQIGAKTIPCYIAKGLDEKGERDLWRSSNLIHRKLSPYNYAQLVQSYTEDYDKYGLKGGKRKYAASKCGIGEGSVDRYLTILKMPESIKERCKDSSFPYAALVDARKFDEDALALLESRINTWYAKNPSIIMEQKDLKRIIKKVAEDSRYEDTSIPDTDPEAESDEGQDFISSQYRQYVKQLKQKTSGRYAKSDAVYADETIGKAAEDLFAVLDSGKCMIINQVTARSALRVLKETVKKMESMIN